MPPGAEVFIDSIDTGTITPVTHDLSEGEHTYLFRLSGYEEFNGMLTVDADYNYVIAAALKETSIVLQQQLNQQMINIARAGLAIATVGVFIALWQQRKRGD